ncbi:MAG: dipeptide epimerase [Myxococcota bacterium]|jgi:L-Ala-D/L-Glu epimerase|nr:dipeptide epimerase [Myxococcota bacterium]
MLSISEVGFRPFDVPLDEPFGIAGGTQHVARNVLVEVRLADGTRGLGEAAPFPAVNGETQDDALSALSGVRELLAGRDLRRLRPLAALCREALSETPSALCAVETALLDAFTRHHRVSLWSYFGGAETELVTDITIPTGDRERATTLAKRAVLQGFGTLKIKIGGAAPELDVERVLAVHAAAPEAKLVLDANESLSARETLELLGALGTARRSVVLLEQPTPAADLDELRRVREQSGIPVAADESARSTRDVLALANAGAASVVNVKIMKTGVFEAWDMIRCARAHGLGLMVGGMVETELAMSTSACLAAGLGGFGFVDLDTPMFLAKRPLSGGFEQTGPRLRLDRIDTGHGVCLV